MGIFFIFESYLRIKLRDIFNRPFLIIGGIIFTLLSHVENHKLINCFFYRFFFNYEEKFRATMRRAIFFLCFLLLGLLHVSITSQNLINLFKIFIQLRYEKENIRDWSWEIFLTGNYVDNFGYERPQLELSLRQRSSIDLKTTYRWPQRYWNFLFPFLPLIISSNSQKKVRERAINIFLLLSYRNRDVAMTLNRYIGCW